MSGCVEADIYVVDVCGTLVRDDTTLGLLDYHFCKDGSRFLRGRIFKSVCMRRSLFWFMFAVAEKETGRHLLKHFAVRLLAGERLEALERSAREYSELLMAKRRVPTVRLLLEQPFSHGRVVLASASLEPIVAALAAAAGARYVASTLEHHEGVLTGHYETDLTGGKRQALLKKFGDDILTGRVFVITDNLTDRSLMDNAARAYVVLHDPAHRERWRGVNAIFIGVDE